MWIVYRKYVIKLGKNGDDRKYVALNGVRDRARARARLPARPKTISGDCLSNVMLSISINYIETTRTTMLLSLSQVQAIHSQIRTQSNTSALSSFVTSHAPLTQHCTAQHNTAHDSEWVRRLWTTDWFQINPKKSVIISHLMMCLFDAFKCKAFCVFVLLLIIPIVSLYLFMLNVSCTVYPSEVMKNQASCKFVSLVNRSAFKSTTFHEKQTTAIGNRQCVANTLKFFSNSSRFGKTNDFAFSVNKLVCFGSEYSFDRHCSCNEHKLDRLFYRYSMTVKFYLCLTRSMCVCRTQNEKPWIFLSTIFNFQLFIQFFNVKLAQK